ncbi:hypothetical protein CLAFUW4_20118 [Fulvia fulva]|nr:uncharacterized protein CLAFUR5_20395 [Fulvia fulva]KAK4628872.1 hypothetical protein CLAFUR4_20120 [Fulvia fulva]WMI38832.1 hypothetical protein CLAFUR5_20395 [Fulvia fulva]WPV12510.1 hypothetical protein CLAFUW4_20118 [Fulvia fulva]WPV27515.1 hypothetical protein CLAFUW7_20119 [Fulvia fulva]
MSVVIPTKGFDLLSPTTSPSLLATLGHSSNY